MHLPPSGIAIMLTGPGLLLALVSRAVEPGLAQPLLAYAAAFGGLLVGIAGLIQLLSARR
jgi:hypothetical protein